MIVPAHTLSRYLEHLEQFLIPRYEAASGLISVFLLQRPFVAYVELVTLSMWQSDEDMTRFLESRACLSFPTKGSSRLNPMPLKLSCPVRGSPPMLGDASRNNPIEHRVNKVSRSPSWMGVFFL